jgi:hypothetical protein
VSLARLTHETALCFARVSNNPNNPNNPIDPSKFHRTTKGTEILAKLISGERDPDIDEIIAECKVMPGMSGLTEDEIRDMFRAVLESVVSKGTS